MNILSTTFSVTDELLLSISNNYIFNSTMQTTDIMCWAHIELLASEKNKLFWKRDNWIFRITGTTHTERTASVSNNKCYYSMFSIEFLSLKFWASGKGLRGIRIKFLDISKMQHLFELNFNSPDRKINENHQIQKIIIIIIQSLGNNDKWFYLMGPPPWNPHQECLNV